MNERDQPRRLSEREMACLRYLFRYYEATLSQFEQPIVGRLLAAGLIEQAPKTIYPGLAAGTLYRLTARGRAVLVTGD